MSYMGMVKGTEEHRASNKVAQDSEWEKAGIFPQQSYIIERNGNDPDEKDRGIMG